MFQSSNSSGLPDRRSFLGKVTGLIMATVAGVLGVAATRFALFPAFKRNSEEGVWRVVGALDDIPEHQPIKRNIVLTQDAGWGQFNSQRLVWVIRDGSHLTVFSATCPHLGCTVNTTIKGFICPCHGSAWDAEGRHLGGPALRGLDVLEYRVDDGILQVKYRYFKQGVKEKIVLS